MCSNGLATVHGMGGGDPRFQKESDAWTWHLDVRRLSRRRQVETASRREGAVSTPYSVLVGLTIRRLEQPVIPG